MVAFPAGVAPLPGPAQVHVVAAPSPLPTRQSGTLARVQVPADRPVQRRQRRHCHRRGCARVVLLPHVVGAVDFGRSAGLGEQLAVHGGRVPAPQNEVGVQLRGDREPLPLLRAGPSLGTRGGQPAPTVRSDTPTESATSRTWLVVSSPRASRASSRSTACCRASATGTTCPGPACPSSCGTSTASTPPGTPRDRP